MPVIRPMTRGRRRRRARARPSRRSTTSRAAATRTPEPPPPDLATAAAALPRTSCAPTPSGCLGGRGRAGPRGLRAGGPARGHLGPVAADRAPGRCSPPGVGSRAAAPRARLRRTARAGRIILASPDPRALRAYVAPRAGPAPVLLRQRRRRSGVRAPDGRPRGRRRRHPVHRGGRPPRRAAARTAPTSRRCWRWARRCWSCPSAATPSSATARCGCSAAVRRRERRRAAARRAGARWTARSRVDWITAAQQWAVEVCVEARLELRTDTGAVFLGGDVGPFPPYLPSGAFL